MLLVWLSERGRSEDVTLDTHRKMTLDADLRLPVGAPSTFGAAEACSGSHFWVEDEGARPSVVIL